MVRQWARARMELCPRNGTGVRSSLLGPAGLHPCPWTRAGGGGSLREPPAPTGGNRYAGSNWKAVNSSHIPSFGGGRRAWRVLACVLPPPSLEQGSGRDGCLEGAVRPSSLGSWGLDPLAGQ